jgi:hypothetical protein
MRFGLAREVITPTFRMNMDGYGTRFGKQFVGVHDDLYVKAIVLEDSRGRALWVTFDLLMHEFALNETLAEHARSRHGVPPENVVVSYTHTHAGPISRGYEPGQDVPEYEAFLLDRARACIDRAMMNLEEGEMSYGAVEGDWNLNRRLAVDGVMHNRPNFAGNKDRTLCFLVFRNRGGEVRGLFLNFACHPVTLGDTMWLSGEFPGRLCQVLESRLYGCTAAFFQGAGATTRPFVAAGPNNRWKCCSFEEVDAIASAMAACVLNALVAGRTEPVALDLASRAFVVELETEATPKVEYQAMHDRSRSAWERNRLAAILARYDSTGNTVPLHAGVLRLSADLYVAWLCGEVCLEVKQQVEKVFPGKRLIFIGYCDGTAYIPDDGLLDEGGYEVDGSIVEFLLKGRFKKGINVRLHQGFGEALRSIESVR